MQEIEPDNWNRMTERLAGVNTAGMNKWDLFQVPRKLPHMFSDWKEYKDYLMENLITDPKKVVVFTKKFAVIEKKYGGMNDHVDRDMYRQMCTTILANDIDCTKIGNWVRRPELSGWHKWRVKGITPETHNKYISYETANQGAVR